MSALKFEYSSAYDPPAPIIKLKVANPNTEATTDDDFLVDSGADITLLKKEIFEILDLHYSGSMHISGVLGVPEELPVSWIQVATPLGTNEFIKVAITPVNDENILGRDVINRWRLLLDGPQEQLSFPT